MLESSKQHIGLLPHAVRAGNENSSPPESMQNQTAQAGKDERSDYNPKCYLPRILSAKPLHPKRRAQR